jgi:processing peptidase subunit alpha
MTSLMLDIMGYHLAKLALEPIGAKELDRAKNQLRSMLFINLESKVAHMEDLGRQVQMRGSRICPRDMSERIEAVTARDVQQAMHKILQNDMAYVQLGSDKVIPDMNSFRQRFGLGSR